MLMMLLSLQAFAQKNDVVLREFISATDAKITINDDLGTVKFIKFPKASAYVSKGNNIKAKSMSFIENTKLFGEITSNDLVDAVNRTLINTNIMLKGKVAAKRELAKKLTLDRIEQLNEALAVAQRLGITEKEDNKSNLQSVIVGEESTAVTQAPLYFLGTKILHEEIQSLKNRKSEDPFIPGLRILEENIQTLELSKLSYGDVRAAAIDQPATVPTVRNAPKRKLIVFVITFLGLLISFFYILVWVFCKRFYRSRNSISFLIYLSYFYF